MMKLNDSLQEDPDLNKLEDFCKFIEHPNEWKAGDFCYSNVGFVVLGEIIEQISNKDIHLSEQKKSYWDAIEEYVLKPAEPIVTRDIPISEKPFATNSIDIKSIKTVDIASSPAGANMWATPKELEKFADWFIQQIQKDPNFKVQLMNTREQIFKGEEMYYSFGVTTSQNIHGQDYYQHNGGAPGISSYLQICPATETTEIIFINNDSENARLAERVASKLEANVISVPNIYYADKKFSDNPDELFNQVAKDVGVKLSSRSGYKF